MPTSVTYQRPGASCVLTLIAVAAVLVGPPRHNAPAASAEAGDADDAEVALFDGKTLDGWLTTDGKPVTKGWAVEDGCLVHLAHGGGDIFTAESFEDFDLSFEFKISPGVNNGLKYRVRRYDGEPIGPEYQIVDEQGERPKPRSETGSLYALYETAPARTLKPPGQWNRARVVARGAHLEHWLNGVRLFEAEIGSADWKERHGKSKFARRTGFGAGAGPIMLTDHAPAKGTGEPDKVWFRGLTLRRLKI